MQKFPSRYASHFVSNSLTMTYLGLNFPITIIYYYIYIYKGGALFSEERPPEKFPIREKNPPPAPRIRVREGERDFFFTGMNKRRNRRKRCIDFESNTLTTHG